MKFEYVDMVFIVIQVRSNPKEKEIIAVFTNQYAADAYAWDFNEMARKAGVPQRYAVICRSLCR